MQRGRNSGFVWRESIGCDLESRARGCVADSLNRDIRGPLVTLAQRDVEIQFRVEFDCNERVGVAKVLIVLGPDALLLLANKGPQPVAHFTRTRRFVGGLREPSRAKLDRFLIDLKPDELSELLVGSEGERFRLFHHQSVRTALSINYLGTLNRPVA